MNITKPTIRKRLASAALVFALLGAWTSVLASMPAAVDQRLDQLEATAAPNVAALADREAAEGQRTPSDVQPPVQVKNEPVAKPVKVFKNAKITHYEAEVAQTDSTPCIGAMGGVDFCNPPFPIVANNCLALGSKVEILGKRYTVADRMNSRYGCSVFDVLNGKGLPSTSDVTVL